MKRIVLMLCLLLAGFSAIAQRSRGYNESIDLKLDRFDGRYAKGETVSVTAEYAPGFTGNVVVNVIENGKKASTEVVKAVSGTVFSASYDAPTLVYVNVAPENSPKDMTSVGFIVDAEGFEPGFPYPRDMKKFWKKQIKALRSVPMVSSAKPVAIHEKGADGYECFEIRVNSIDSIPCSGYLVRPVNAVKKSLPIVMFLHGAGVAGPSKRSSIKTALRYARMGGGAIALDLNAHGMDNDRPQSYYDSLETGPLKDYSKRAVTDHESFYFRSMFLRTVRALDYLVKDPAWDGKRVMVFGSSQGGAQSAAIAGLDKRVGAAVLLVPAMMDMGGELAGHNKAWFYTMGKQPESASEIVPYYDGANLIRNFKGKLWVEAGLIDSTCPASCVFSGYNKALKCSEKHILTYPYRPHPEPEGRYREAWVEKVLAPRTDFINSYLAPKK